MCELNNIKKPKWFQINLKNNIFESGNFTLIKIFKLQQIIANNIPFYNEVLNQSP